MITRDELKKISANPFWTDWKEKISKETITFCNTAFDKALRAMGKEGNFSLWIPFYKCSIHEELDFIFGDNWRYEFCTIGAKCQLLKICNSKDIPTYIHLPTFKEYLKEHGFSVEENQCFIGEAGINYRIFWG